VQEGCGYKDTPRAHRYFAPLAKYFTMCITYQPPLVISRWIFSKWDEGAWTGLSWLRIGTGGGYL
jgi:hypothetical protein